ncbi:hypothetical protein K505DRAFT_333108 [Melanomma pulvis-pyrius CBS 109.77]|uniref:Uncharacterized protein n=1 Tax=Melanomma pulvis-pyrius CBS 109.77 TaxID=1314802 RepID=A0A6A6XT75_9PLEO|nr:hypothetical protein K505DRAFT_333108 [Melanomma pulvis-pyrius CBS 109.77]
MLGEAWGEVEERRGRTLGINGGGGDGQRAGLMATGVRRRRGAAGPEQLSDSRAWLGQRTVVWRVAVVVVGGDARPAPQTGKISLDVRWPEALVALTCPDWLPTSGAASFASRIHCALVRPHALPAHRIVNTTLLTTGPGLQFTSTATASRYIGHRPPCAHSGQLHLTKALRSCPSYMRPMQQGPLHASLPTQKQSAITTAPTRTYMNSHATRNTLSTRLPTCMQNGDRGLGTPILLVLQPPPAPCVTVFRHPIVLPRTARELCVQRALNTGARPRSLAHPQPVAAGIIRPRVSIRGPRPSSWRGFPRGAVVELHRGLGQRPLLQVAAVSRVRIKIWDQ